MNSLLFIEDDDAIRLALSLALEDEGYEVRQAPDGRSGLTLFQEREPDLVLLDLRLPDLSGFDVCRQLRSSSIVPIIIVTAQTDTYDLVAGLEAALGLLFREGLAQVFERHRLLTRAVHAAVDGWRSAGALGWCY